MDKEHEGFEYLVLFMLMSMMLIPMMLIVFYPNPPGPGARDSEIPTAGSTSTTERSYISNEKVIEHRDV